MADTKDLPLLMTVREACAVIRCSRSRLYELVAEGLLVPRKLGSSTLFRRDDVMAFIDALPTAPARASREG